jgi:hypothetical protein
MPYDARDPMTGKPLTAPLDIEVQSYKDLYALNETCEGMPHHDLVVFMHRLLVERVALQETAATLKARLLGTLSKAYDDHWKRPPHGDDEAGSSWMTGHEAGLERACRIVGATEAEVKAANLHTICVAHAAHACDLCGFACSRCSKETP